MPLIHYFLAGWKNAFTYSGRSRRTEFWWFYLGNVTIGIVLYILRKTAESTVEFFTIAFFAYGIAALFPAIALAIRRLHDINKSGWFFLVGLILIIGTIFLLIWFLTDSYPEENQYGPCPKADLPPRSQ